MAAHVKDDDYGDSSTNSPAATPAVSADNCSTMTPSSLWEFDVFISHSWGTAPTFENHEHAMALAKELRAQGLKVWIDQDNLAKQNILMDIGNALKKCRSVIFLVDETYMAKVCASGHEPLNMCKAEFNQAIGMIGIESLVIVRTSPSAGFPPEWPSPLSTLCGRYIFNWFKDQPNEVQELTTYLQKLVSLPGTGSTPTAAKAGGAVTASAPAAPWPSPMGAPPPYQVSSSLSQDRASQSFQEEAAATLSASLTARPSWLNAAAPILNDDFLRNAFLKAMVLSLPAATACGTTSTAGSRPTWATRSCAACA